MRLTQIINFASQEKSSGFSKTGSSLHSYFPFARLFKLSLFFISSGILMKIKSFLAKPYAAIVHKRIQKSMQTAVADQNNILQNLIKHGSKTVFGNDHHLQDVKTYSEFNQ